MKKPCYPQDCDPDCPGEVLVETGVPFSIDLDERKRKLMENYKKIWRHRAGVLWRHVGEPIAGWCVCAGLFAGIVSPLWVGGLISMYMNGRDFMACVNERLGHTTAPGVVEWANVGCRAEVLAPPLAFARGAIIGLCVGMAAWALFTLLKPTFDQIRREWNGPEPVEQTEIDVEIAAAKRARAKQPFNPPTFWEGKL